MELRSRVVGYVLHAPFREICWVSSPSYVEESVKTSWARESPIKNSCEQKKKTLEQEKVRQKLSQYIGEGVRKISLKTSLYLIREILELKAEEGVQNLGLTGK